MPSSTCPAASFHRLSQTAPRPEGGYRRFGNLHHVTGLGIPPLPSGPLPGLKGAETDQLHLFTGAKGFGNLVQEAVDHRFDILFGHAALLGNPTDQFLFVHPHGPPPEVRSSRSEPFTSLIGGLWDIVSGWREKLLLSLEKIVYKFRPCFQNPRRLASSHQASSLSREKDSTGSPASAARCSTKRNRRINLRQAVNSACSASTSKNRARATAENSRSPSSSSLFSKASARNSSSRSSSNLSRTSSRRDQSNPTWAARFCSSVAWRRAGNRGTPSRRDSACGRPFSARSRSLIASHFSLTSSASEARSSPNTWGWRRISFSVSRPTTSRISKYPSSRAIWAWRTT